MPKGLKGYVKRTAYVKKTAKRVKHRKKKR